MSKILFILKLRQTSQIPGTWNYSEGSPLSSGLTISAKQVVEMLKLAGIEVNLVQVVDNNEIDKWVHHYKPTHVIIEALWVVPDKFDVLKRLHPNVQWIVRVHSNVDFLAHEGTVVDWIFKYVDKDVYVACNSKAATDNLLSLIPYRTILPRIIYLPNYYSLDAWGSLLSTVSEYNTQFGDLQKQIAAPTYKIQGELNIGCLGAVRPLKNHMPQAIAAINIAKHFNVNLNFHINSTRIEGPAGGIVKALRAVFNLDSRYKLVEAPWMEYNTFQNYLIHNIDLMMQVSHSETFNIVGADAVNNQIPLLASRHIPWLNLRRVVYNTTDVDEITSKGISMWETSNTGVIQTEQLSQLYNFCKEAKRLWLEKFL